MTDVITLSVEKQLHGKELDFKRYSSVAYNFGVHNNWVWPEQSSTDSAHSPVEYQQLRSAKFTSKWPMIGHLHLFFLEQECLYIWLIACNFRLIFVGIFKNRQQKRNIPTLSLQAQSLMFQVQEANLDVNLLKSRTQGSWNLVLILITMHRIKKCQKFHH